MDELWTDGRFYPGRIIYFQTGNLHPIFVNNILQFIVFLLTNEDVLSGTMEGRLPLAGISNRKFVITAGKEAKCEGVGGCTRYGLFIVKLRILIKPETKLTMGNLYGNVDATILGTNT